MSSKIIFFICNIGIFSFLGIATTAFSPTMAATEASVPVPIVVEEYSEEVLTLNRVEKKAGTLHVKIGGIWYRLTSDTEILLCNQKSTTAAIFPHTGQTVFFATNANGKITTLHLLCK